jgi:hypothetical protein
MMFSLFRFFLITKIFLLFIIFCPQNNYSFVVNVIMTLETYNPIKRILIGTGWFLSNFETTSFNSENFLNFSLKWIVYGSYIQCSSFGV